jgi:hypothetical protein
MDYPTMEQVEGADLEQICRWYRFLDTPGKKYMGSSAANFEEIENEVKVINRISERYRQLGGFTPAISKKIGWVPPE